MRRNNIGWIGLLLGISSVAAAEHQFTPEDRDKALAYWRSEGRYDSAPPKDATEKGLWQVRLTVNGSTWLWNYNKARKLSAPPTLNPTPQTDAQKVWDDWVLQKLAADRWAAYLKARKANQLALGKDLPTLDKSLPASEPPSLGPIPQDLLDLCGNPPSFAEAVVPMEHAVAFEDLTLTYRDNPRLSNPRYAYYRFNQGVMSEGVSVKTLPKEQLDHLFNLAGVTDSEAKVMRAVSVLEGGFDSINTYDTGYVSVGFIQFACLKEGGGSLGTMLAEYKAASPEGFAADFHRFGIDVTSTGLLDVIDPATGAEIEGPPAVQRLIEDKRLIAVFQRAGLKSETFCAAQIRSAKRQFMPTNDVVTFDVNGQSFTGKIGDIIKSEAGIATLMDRKVNTGKVDPLPIVLSRVAVAHSVQSVEELAKYEAEIVAPLKYRKDYLADPTLTQPGTVSLTPLKERASNKADRGGGVRGHRKTKPSSRKSL